MNSKIIAYLFVLSISIISATALGIGPVQHYEIFESGNVKAMSFLIFNNEKQDLVVEVFAKGDLEEYIEFDQRYYAIDASRDNVKVNYLINYPTELPPGAHYTDLVVMETQAGDSSTVVAAQSHISRLRIQVPYTEKYAEAKLNINPETNKVNFNIDLYNYWTNDITADAIIEVYEDNEKIRSLQTSEVIINPMREGTLTASDEFEDGTYTAKALVNYDEKTIRLEDDFTVGLLNIEIIKVNVDEFIAGDVAKINIKLKNNWPESIDGVYGDILISKDDKYVETIQTETFTIDTEKDMVAYWNTQGKQIGTYDATLFIHYNDQTSMKRFNIDIMGEEEVIIEESDGPNILLIFVMLVLFIILFYHLWKLYKRA